MMSPATKSSAAATVGRRVRAQHIPYGAAREPCDKIPLFADRFFKASAYAFLFNQLSGPAQVPLQIP
jgi:hypothetical protein